MATRVLWDEFMETRRLKEEAAAEKARLAEESEAAKAAAEAARDLQPDFDGEQVTATRKRKWKCKMAGIEVCEGPITQCKHKDC